MTTLVDYSVPNNKLIPCAVSPSAQIPAKRPVVVLDFETHNTDARRTPVILTGTISEDGKENITKALPYPAELNGSSIVAHNAKFELTILKANGFKDIQVEDDTMLMAYLLDPSQEVKMETLHEKYFKEHKKDLVEVYNDEVQKEKPDAARRVNLPDNWYEKVSVDALSTYLREDLHTTARLRSFLTRQLREKPEVYAWYREVELVIVVILTEMEYAGVQIDKDRLQQLSEEFTRDCGAILERLNRLAGRKPDGEPYNLNSTKQLQEVLFEKFKLPKTEKTKTGYSTDIKSLQQVLSKTNHIFVRLLLEYRELSKLLSTYCNPILERLDNDDRLHGSFNQTFTVTHRLSSSSPNLQNIPSKKEIGRLIRECFIAKKGHKLYIADYGQVELRILAHYSQDEALLKIFTSGEDLHEATGRLMGKDRQTGKIINFSLMYGKSAYGFGEDWGVSQESAQATINDYFNAFPGVQFFMEKQKAVCVAKKGWMTDIAGLPLYCGNPNTPDKWERQTVLRRAVNYPIQSSSQAIIKKAMVNIYKRFGLCPVLQVHDEVVYEIPDNGNLENLTNNLTFEMENAFQLKNVNLTVDAKVTDKWEK